MDKLSDNDTTQTSDMKQQVDSDSLTFQALCDKGIIHIRNITQVTPDKVSVEPFEESFLSSVLDKKKENTLAFAYSEIVKTSTDLQSKQYTVTSESDPSQPCVNFDELIQKQKKHIKRTEELDIAGLRIEFALYDAPERRRINMLLDMYFKAKFSELCATVSLLSRDIKVRDTEMMWKRLIREELIEKKFKSHQLDHLEKSALCGLIDQITILAKQGVLRHLKLHTIHASDMATGNFIPLTSDLESNSQIERPLISEQAIGVTLNPHFNLSWDDMVALKTWCFARDRYERTKAKIQLLHRAEGPSRTMLIRDPLATLEKSFLEYGLTRSEILDMLFQSTEKQRSLANICIHCGMLIDRISDQTIIHPQDCELTDWLCTRYQFRRIGEQISAPKLKYVHPGIAKVLTRLQDKLTSITDHQEIVHGETGITITTFDKKFQIKKLTGVNYRQETRPPKEYSPNYSPRYSHPKRY